MPQLIQWWQWLNTLVVRDLWRNRLRSLLTLLGIALGVAIWVAIQLANQSVLVQFESSLDQVLGDANLVITPNNQPDLPESSLQRLKPLWAQHVQWTPVVDQTALWPKAPYEAVRVMGIDWFSDLAFRNRPAGAQSSGNQGPQPTGDITALFTPYNVLAGAQLLRDYHLHEGDDLKLLVNDHQVTFHVLGTLPSDGLGGAYNGRVLMMDIGLAQSLFGMAGRVSRVDVLAPKAQLDQLEAQLQRTVPPGLQVQRSSQRNAQSAKMLRAFQVNLTALSFISLLVGAFLIYNTMTISVVRRRPEIGTLRTLGWRQWQIATLFGTEALLLGLAGTLFGLALGALFAQFSIQGMSTTVETLYTGQPVAQLIWLPHVFALGLVFGVGLTLAASAAPIWEAIHVEPAQTLRPGLQSFRQNQRSAPFALGGLVTFGLAAWMACQPPVMQLPLWGYASAFCLILGTAFVTPWLLANMGVPLLSPVCQKLMGAPGLVAVRSLSGSLGRTAIATTSLMVGIALMVSLAVMIASFRETVNVWVNQTLKADLWVEPAGKRNSRQQGELSQAVVLAAQQTPGVALVDRFYEFPIRYHNEPALMGVGDATVIGRKGHLLFMDGRDTQSVFAPLLSPQHPGVIVSESFANRHQVATGDTLKLETPTGPVGFTVGGVYYDYASEFGYIIMPRTHYERFFHDTRVSNLAVYVADGASVANVRNAFYQRVQQLAPGTQLRVRTNAELRAEVFRVFEQTFAITYALHAIAIAVALLAVLNTLLTLVAEARRELAILTYLGTTAGQIKRLVLTQAALLGLFGNMGGLALGLVLSVLLVAVINKQSFGWTIQWLVPWGFLAQSSLLVLATAVVAGWLPARLAAKTVAPEVIRAE
jgi:putative ABC transport system permease protein